MNLRRPNDLEYARQARRSVNLIRLRLLNPTAKTLEGCAPHLRIAIGALETLQHALTGSGSVASQQAKLLAAELKELRCELGQINALMKQAADFHAALAELLSPEDTSVRYAATGIVPIRPAATVFAEG